MTATFKPVTALQNPELPWLGRLPGHWAVQRLRNAVDMRVSNVDKHSKERELPVRLCNYTDVYKHDRIRDDMPFMRATASPEEISRFRLELDDVLITKDSETWNDIGVPALVEAPADDLICGYHLALLRPRPGRLSGGYLFRALQSTVLAYQFHVEANGVTRYGLSHAAIKSIWLPLPPLPEQHAIVRFLDYMDRRIRRYIRAKQKLIKLLEEQKQAIVHRAVTRGLDPNVRLKPSGVDWLGEVPEHWEVRKLKHCVRSIGGIQMGPFGASLTDLQYNDTGYKLYGQENTISGDFHRGGRWLTESQFRGLLRYELVPGDLVLTRKGSIGKCRMVPQSAERGIADSDTIRLRLNSEVAVPHFVVQLLHAAPYIHKQIHSVQRGAVLGGLNTSTIAGLRLVVPPVAEQCQLLEAIDRDTSQVSASIASVDGEIALLREYRTRLIADVVTGRLDVREAAANLPDEGEDAEAIDAAGAIAEVDEDTLADLEAIPEETEV